MQSSHLPPQHQLKPMENPLPAWNSRKTTAGKKLMITQEADTFMHSLNLYEKTQVYKEALKLTSDGGYGWNSRGFQKAPMFMRHKICSGGISFMYSVNPEMIVINRMKLEREITQVETPVNRQQMGLFEVRRESDTRWREEITEREIPRLELAWGKPQPVPKIRTEHVAINGYVE
ncbi:hypothetical protein [Hahella sp. KA22]|uniref:hypothetical protein n=1 Tax=Hahella sp. KA22 TaxID=1628392 RepID=UPI001F4D64F4|nr:hypothetical protein [Hahella sp. KA22]